VLVGLAGKTFAATASVTINLGRGVHAMRSIYIIDESDTEDLA